MSTVAQLIDRTLREWLEPPDERPTEAPLNGALTDVATSVTIVDSLLTPEQEDALGPGTVVEVGQELMLLTAASPPALTVTRAWMGTTATTHSDGDSLRAFAAGTNRWTRNAVFNAICDAAEALWPPLYRVRSCELIMDTEPVELDDEEAVDSIEYRYWNGLRYAPWPVELLYPYPSVDSDRAVQWEQPIPTSTQGYLVYKAGWKRPTAETDNLQAATPNADFDVPLRLEKLIIAGAVMHLTAGVDLSAISQEFITRQLELQNFPVQSGASVQQNIIAYYEYLVRNEIGRLEATHPTGSRRLKTRYKVI